MLKDIGESGLLFDLYGQLLSTRQRQVMELYYEENWSLSEIGEELQISRQGVYDALKNGEKSLLVYEEKLGLMNRFKAVVREWQDVEDAIMEVRNSTSDSRLYEKIDEILVQIRDIKNRQ